MSYSWLSLSRNDPYDSRPPYQPHYDRDREYDRDYAESSARGARRRPRSPLTPPRRNSVERRRSTSPIPRDGQRYLRRAGDRSPYDSPRTVPNSSTRVCKHYNFPSGDLKDSKMPCRRNDCWFLHPQQTEWIRRVKALDEPPHSLPGGSRPGPSIRRESPIVESGPNGARSAIRKPSTEHPHASDHQPSPKTVGSPRRDSRKRPRSPSVPPPAARPRAASPRAASPRAASPRAAPQQPAAPLPSAPQPTAPQPTSPLATAPPHAAPQPVAPTPVADAPHAKPSSEVSPPSSESRRTALVNFATALQSVLVAQTKLNVAQSITKRIQRIFPTSDATEIDDEIAVSIFNDEQKAKASLKAAEGHLNNLYNDLVYTGTFNMSLDEVASSLEARLGTTEIRKRLETLEATSKTLEGMANSLQDSTAGLSSSLQANEERLAKFEIAAGHRASLETTAQAAAAPTQVAALSAAKSLPPSLRTPLPSPPPTAAPAKSTDTTRPSSLPESERVTKRLRLGNLAQSFVDRVALVEAAQIETSSEIDQVRDLISDFMFDCSQVTRSVMEDLLEGSGTDESREKIAIELKRIIDLVAGTEVNGPKQEVDATASTTSVVPSIASEPAHSIDAVADSAGPSPPQQPTLPPSLSLADVAALKSELQESLKAELAFDLRSQLKPELAAEAKEEVRQEFQTLITELQEKVDFLETGMSSQITSMWQEFQEHRAHKRDGETR